jgi:hypothetical protein
MRLLVQELPHFWAKFYIRTHSHTNNPTILHFCRVINISHLNSLICLVIHFRRSGHMTIVAPPLRDAFEPCRVCCGWEVYDSWQTRHCLKVGGVKPVSPTHMCMVLDVTLLSCVRLELILCRHPRRFGLNIAFQTRKCGSQHNSESSSWRRLMVQCHYPQHMFLPTASHSELLSVVCVLSLAVTWTASVVPLKLAVSRSAVQCNRLLQFHWQSLF